MHMYIYTYIHISAKWIIDNAAGTERRAYQLGGSLDLSIP
jgi:hypothetical protein